ncbi:MAG TPA: hypothetical protein VMB48_14700, partial [Steroidobacteraceae bacterium]|nr:hypothetical protein [Steroidobacteraceae bacterium]
FSFTAGDLVVSVEGNGSNTAATSSGNTGSDAGSYLDNQAAPLTLYQFSLNGTSSATQTGSLLLPQTSVAGGNYAVSGEYGSSSEGTLQLSGNGQYLTIMGYAVNAETYNSTQDLNGAGTALAQSPNISTNTSTTQPNVARVIALIGANGSVNSTTAISNVFNGNNPRSVYTQNGTSFYISGQGTAGDDTGGVFYVSGLGATTATPITGVDTSSSSNGSYNQDTRDVQIVNGQLTVSVDSSEGSKSHDIDGIGTLGSAGSPPTGTLNKQPTILTGLGGTSTGGAITLNGSNGNSINDTNGESVYLSPDNYFYANSTTLYVADTGDPKNGSKGAGTDAPGLGGLQKWSLVDGSWELDYTLSAGLNLISYYNSSTKSLTSDGVSGLDGLTGEVVNGNVELFATSYVLGDTDQTYLYGITDVLADTQASQVTGEDFTTLAAAPADSDFKGVAFAPVAPVPLPGAAGMFLGALAGLGVLARGRRGRRGLEPAAA